MKILKLSFLSVLSLFAMSYASAQKAYLRAGVNFANVTTTDGGHIDDANTLTSFQVGFVGNLPLFPLFSLQPSILFTGKGSKTQSGNTSDPTYYRATSNPYYLEIPVDLVFKTPGPIGFFAGAGPYVAMGVAGKNKTSGKVLGSAFSSEESIKWSNDDPTTLNYEEGSGFGIMKRFDYGFNFMAGIEGKKTQLSINYDMGLAKLQSGTNSSEDDKNKNRVVSITLGFKL